MTKKMRLLAVAVCSLGFVMATTANTGLRQTANGLSQAEALQLVRMINTIEATMASKDHRYASLQGLAADRHFQRHQPLTLLNGSSASVKDYRLAVVVSTDGQSYQVSLVPAAGCGPALFSSESALIYQGKVLGCAEP